MYILVLLSAALISAIGLSAIAVARINTRRTRDAGGLDKARLLAFSAVETATAVINDLPSGTWRLLYINDIETPAVPVGDGTMSWKFVDADGDLGDNPSDAVRVHGIGRASGSAWAYSVLLAGDTALESLNTCIHSNGQLQIKSGKTLTATGAAASTNANFRNDGYLYGSIDALTQSGGGSVSGTTNVPAASKQMPPAGVFSQWASKATQLPYNGDVDTKVIAPGVNEYAGSLNGDGIYYINTHGKDLRIRDSRIYGTLVINAHNKKVILGADLLMHPYRSGYPVLIVNGNLQIEYDSSQSLSENGAGHNFNPSGAPYLNVTDTDQSDTYPSEVQGLIYCTGDLAAVNASRIRGVVLVSGAATVEDSLQIIHNPSIASNPPAGFSSPTGELTVEVGSWRREPVP